MRKDLAKCMETSQRKFENVNLPCFNAGFSKKQKLPIYPSALIAHYAVHLRLNC